MDRDISFHTQILPIEYIYIYIYIYIYRERERERERVQAGERRKGKEKENLKQAPCSVQSPTQGSIPQPRDHDLSKNQELGT